MPTAAEPNPPGGGQDCPPREIAHATVNCSIGRPVGACRLCGPSAEPAAHRRQKGSKVKIIAVACSPRKGKTTKAALEVCLAAAREVGGGIETELLELAGLSVNGCIACGKCNGGLVCTHDDGFMSLVPALSSADLVGLIVGTPVYLGSMTSQCKAFLDRSVMFRRNGFLFRNKVGGALAVGDPGGHALPRHGGGGRRAAYRPLRGHPVERRRPRRGGR